MLARRHSQRLVAVSPDEAFATKLASTLGVVDVKVEVYDDLAALGVDPLESTLCVIHVAGAVETGLADFLANLAPDCRIIAVLPRSSLVALVEIMERTDRVVGMLVAEDFDAAQLLTMSARVLTGDIFGLDKVMAPGTDIKAVLCEYSQRTLCRARVIAHASQVGVPRRMQTLIEQCIDEMLMNALYDAPVDETGKHVFEGVPVRTRVSLKLATTVVVQYAFDGEQFAISVRDPFGSIERDTVLRVLHKCLHAAQKIDKKAGGAGVGLYLMVNASTAVYFNVIPGVATEAVCTFAVRRTRPQLEQFGFFREAVDVTGALPTERPAGSALRPTEIQRPLGPKLLVAGAVASAAFLGLALWYQLGRDDTPRPPPKPAYVELDTIPTGASVEIDGAPMGETPVTVSTLAPNTKINVTFERKAFKPATVTLEVPPRGGRITHTETLVASDDFVLVRFVTTPAGAQVIDLGEATASRGDRTYTPAELFVEVGKEQRFMLTMPARVPIVVPPFTPQRGDAVLDKGGELVPGATLHVEAPAGGKVTVNDAPHCAALEAPSDCTLGPGSYEVVFTSPQGTKKQTVKLGADDATVTFE